MEGNECYKFSTIKNYIAKTRAKEIEIALDIGANVGTISLMMHAYFPNAKIYGFEAVGEYYELARANTKHINQIKVYRRAVTAQHIFTGDNDNSSRTSPVSLVILKALPEAGPGWGGGSLVLPADDSVLTNNSNVAGFERINQPVRPLTLVEIVKIILRREHAEEIDLIKMDCEGCEHSAIGCSDMETLQRIRFIVGEYHGIKRFHYLMKEKLFRTHKVNLIGDGNLGAFFAERLDGERDGILKFDKRGMLMSRPWLCDVPIDWHLFDNSFVLDQDRYWHAIA
jgi:FkbM family methyltransferase